MKPKIIVIVGPTASGKTALSISLAKYYNGEIISADSRQVYTGLDLGTGKITQEEMEGIPHHLLDVADPKDTYTVSQYVQDGRKKIEEIISQKKIPIIVGGTFFYIDALIGKISTPEVPPNPLLREKLEAMPNEELFRLLKEKDPLRAETIDTDNKRRLVRAIEIIESLHNVPPTKSEELYEVLTLGIQISKEDLKKNIHARLMARMEKGMIDEVKHLHEQGLSYERMEELGLEYKYIAQFLQNKITEEEMLACIETKSIQYAKRQMTWLKRDTTIVWINPSDTKELQEKISKFFIGT